MSKKKFLFQTALVFGAMFLLQSCQSQQVQIPQPPARTFDLNIHIDPSIAKESITIDIFAVAANNLNEFKTMKWSDYMNGQKRNELKNIKAQLSVSKDKTVETSYVCTISYTQESYKQGNPIKYSLSRKDPQWNVWKYYHGEYLLVFTDLNSVSGRGPLIIPLQQNCWKIGSFFSPYQKEININLNFQGISYFPSSLCMIQ
jgi:hypothetical protein